MTTRISLAVVPVLLSAGLLLSACSSGAPTATAAGTSSDAPAASTATCDPEILEFLPEHGYPNPEPQAALTLPDGATTSVEPVCVVHDDFQGAPRDAAFFAEADTEQLRSDLAEAGYTESPDFGESVLLSPSGHQVGLGPAEVGGATLLFVAY